MVEIDIADKWQNRNVIEDALLNDNVLKIIKDLHGEIYKIKKHYEVGGAEVDAILLCKRVKGYKYIGIELKQSDLKKALIQAVLRRIYFHYFYIVSELYNPHTYFGYEVEYLHKYKLLDRFKEYKIGWISTYKNQAFLIFPSFYSKLISNKIKDIIKDDV